MSRLQELSNAFKFQYEKFLHGCDALEEKDEWDVAADGEMEAYYFNDLICIIIKLISADGDFSPAEAKYINDMFGFTYSPEGLKELYETNKNDINTLIDEEIPAGYAKMKSINAGLANLYRDLILQACEIIVESDGIIHIAENKQINRIRACFAE